jgi:hypothetical protein
MSKQFGRYVFLQRFSQCQNNLVDTFSCKDFLNVKTSFVDMFPAKISSMTKSFLPLTLSLPSGKSTRRKKYPQLASHLPNRIFND